MLIHLFPKLPKSIYHLLNKGTSTVLNWDYLIFFQLLKHWALKGNIFFWNGFPLVSHHVWLVMAIRSFLTSIFDFFLVKIMSLCSAQITVGPDEKCKIGEQWFASEHNSIFLLGSALHELQIISSCKYPLVWNWQVIEISQICVQQGF